MKTFGLSVIFSVCAFYLLQSGLTGAGPPPPPPKPKFKIIQEKFEVEKTTPEHVVTMGEVRDGKLYISFHVIEPLPEGLLIDIEVSHEKNGKYVPIEVPGLETKVDFCKFEKTDTIFMPDILKHMDPKPDGCPWGKGWWNLTDYEPSMDKLPPMAPPGKYKTKTSFIMKDEIVHTHNWYGRIEKI